MFPRCTYLLIVVAGLAALAGPAASAQTHAQTHAKPPGKAKPASSAAARAPGSPAPTPCDVLADDPEDPFRTAPGVEARRIDPAKAVATCKAAVDAAPEDGRLRYAYSRALQRAGDEAGALDALQRAAERGYPIAENMVGMLYQQQRQPEQAVPWIRRSASCTTTGRAGRPRTTPRRSTI
jgi:TPR repeat protein